MPQHCTETKQWHCVFNCCKRYVLGQEAESLLILTEHPFWLFQRRWTWYLCLPFTIYLQILVWFYIHPVGLLTSPVWSPPIFSVASEEAEYYIFYFFFTRQKQGTVCVCVYVCTISGFSSVPLWPYGHTPWGPSGSSVHGILQTRTLKWVVMLSSWGSIFPTQWLNLHLLCLLHWQMDYLQHHLGSPNKGPG